MSTKSRILGAFILGLLGSAVQADDPLSAIDWLSNTVTTPQPDAVQPSTGAAIESITVSPLDSPKVDAVGLLPNAITGLPADLWGPSDPAELARLIARKDPDLPPSAQRLLVTLLVAELDAPTQSTDDGVLFLARLDKLLELGALDRAQAMLERAGPTDPAKFRRWFDVALLTDREDRACAAMLANPGIAPTFPARIFCLARQDDWNAAALTLETGKALGFLTDEEDALLLRFLDDSFMEVGPPLKIPPRPSPLVFRIFEAIGTPLPTTHLPLAFAHADLRNTTGWKAQVEAAERLARTGAISSNRLLGIYSARRPAASGGVWDRVAAIQALDVALLAKDISAVSKTLPDAWSAAREAHLEAAFATLYGERLNTLALNGEVKALALNIGLLSDAYETVAQNSTADIPFLASVATGAPANAPQTPMALAIIDAFDPTSLRQSNRDLIAEGKLGEAILMAIHLSASGDAQDVGQALTVLRQIGLEDTARRIALERLILEPAT